MESISETRCKLIQRRHEVTRRSVANETTRSSNLPEVGKTVTSGITRGTGPYAVTNRCIWNGKEISSDPRILAPAKELERASSAIYGPQPRTHDWSDVGVREVVMTPLLPKSSPIPKKQISKQLQLSMTVHKPGTQSETVIKTVPPILKLIPSQVKSAHKKIIFHPKSNTNLGVSTGDQSLDSTISKVREKIRSVTVPRRSRARATATRRRTGRVVGPVPRRPRLFTAILAVQDDNIIWNKNSGHNGRFCVGDTCHQ